MTENIHNLGPLSRLKDTLLTKTMNLLAQFAQFWLNSHSHDKLTIADPGVCSQNSISISK